jgi:hypothetical protein
MTSRDVLRTRSRDAALRAPTLRPMRLLQALAAADAGMSTPQLVEALEEHIEPYWQALTRYSAVLRRHAAAGRVERVGKTPGAYQRPPASIWQITPAGRAWLEDRRSAASAAEAPATTATEPAAALARRQAALTTAGALYGRDTPLKVRTQVSRELRALGCTFVEIGKVFGVSRSTIQADVRTSEQP